MTNEATVGEFDPAQVPPLMSTGTGTQEDAARTVLEALALQPEQRRILTELCLVTAQLRYAERTGRERLARTERDGITATEQRDQALHEVQLWRNEWQRWSSRVLDEANERDWCSSYDDWSRESNANFTLTVLPARTREVTNTFRVTFNGTIPYGNDDWAPSLEAVLRSMRDHSETEWVEDWNVEWERVE